LDFEKMKEETEALEKSLQTVMNVLTEPEKNSGVFESVPQALPLLRDRINALSTVSSGLLNTTNEERELTKRIRKLAKDCTETLSEKSFRESFYNTLSERMRKFSDDISRMETFLEKNKNNTGLTNAEMKQAQRLYGNVVEAENAMNHWKEIFNGDDSSNMDIPAEATDKILDEIASFDIKFPKLKAKEYAGILDEIARSASVEKYLNPPELFRLDGGEGEYPDIEAVKAAARKHSSHLYKRPLPLAEMTEGMMRDLMSVLDEGKPVSANHFNLGLGGAVAPYLPADNLSDEERADLEEMCGTKELEKKLSDIMLGFREDEYGYIGKNLKGDSKTSVRALANASDNMSRAVEELMLKNSALLRTLHSHDPEERKWATRRMMEIMENALRDYERRANDLIDRLDPAVLAKKSEDWQTFKRAMEQEWHSSQKTLTDPQNMFAQFVLFSFCPGFAFALVAPLVLPAILSAIAGWKEKRALGESKRQADMFVREKSDIGAARLLGTTMASRLVPYLGVDVSPAELSRMLDESKQENKKFIDEIKPMLEKIYAPLTQYDPKTKRADPDALLVKPDSPEAARIKEGYKTIAEKVLLKFFDARKVQDEKGVERLVIGSDHLATMGLVGEVAEAVSNAKFFEMKNISHRAEGSSVAEGESYVLSVKKDDLGTLDFKDASKLGKEFVDSVQKDAERYSKNLNSIVEDVFGSEDFMSFMYTVNFEESNKDDNKDEKYELIDKIYGNTVGERSEMFHRRSADSDEWKAWPNSVGELKTSLAERKYVQYSLLENATKTTTGIGLHVDVKPATIVAALQSMGKFKEENQKHPTQKGSEMMEATKHAFLADMTMRIVPQKAWAAIAKKDERLVAAAERFERVASAHIDRSARDKKNNVPDRKKIFEAIIGRHEAEKHVVMAKVTAMQLKEEIRLKTERNAVLEKRKDITKEEKQSLMSETVSERLMKAALAYHAKEAYELSEKSAETLRGFDGRSDDSPYVRSINEMLDAYGIADEERKRDGAEVFADVSETVGNDIMEELFEKGWEKTPPDSILKTAEKKIGTEFIGAMDALDGLICLPAKNPVFRRETEAFIQLGNAVAMEDAMKKLLGTTVGDRGEAERERALGMPEPKGAFGEVMGALLESGKSKSAEPSAPMDNSGNGGGIGFFGL